MSDDDRIEPEEHPKPKTIPSVGTTPRGPDSATPDEKATAGPLRPVPPAPAPKLDRVRCFWCDRIHAGPHPLAVCAVCSASYETLRSLDMRGSFALSDPTIDVVMTRVAPGNFALGYMDGDTFSVYYVGRSDCDVRASVHDWVGMPSAQEAFGSNSKAPWAAKAHVSFPMAVPIAGRVGNADSSYTHFAFSYARSAEDAFAKEIRNFDNFGGLFALDNSRVPTAPL